jgi:hypothetical protein
VAIWTQAADGGGSHIRANRFNVDQDAWLGSVKVDRDLPAMSEQPSVAINALGYTVAVFVQGGNVWTNDWDPVHGSPLWGTPLVMNQPGALSVMGPCIGAAGTTGTFSVVWGENSPASANFQFWGVRSGFSGWGPVHSVATDQGSKGMLACDLTNAVLTWTAVVDSQPKIIGGYYGTSGTLAPETRELGEAAGLFDQDHRPRVAHSPGGYATVIWTVGQTTLSSRRTSGFNWLAPAPVGDGLGATEHADIASDGAGNSIATWVQHDATQTRVWVNFERWLQAWGTPERLEPPVDGKALRPHVAMAQKGNEPGDGMVVWQQADGAKMQVWARSYR